MQVTDPSPGECLFRQPDSEFRRLTMQDAYWSDATSVLLVEAGLAQGMRVLDLGSGDGDVTFLAAGLVGPAGRVVGVDRSRAAVSRATARAAELRMDHVSFRQADLETLVPDESFDAIIGRFVLMYLANPGQTLRRLVARLRPGVIVAFLDLDTSVARSAPMTPLVERAIDWLWEASWAAGTPSDLGARLWQVFRTAGFNRPRLLIRSRLEPPPALAACRYLAETVRSALPMIERHGIATAAEVEVDTLAERLSAALLEHDATFYPPQAIGAYAKT